METLDAHHTAVIALGGNAISSAQGHGTLEEQRAAVQDSAAQIAEIIADGRRVVLTHGNGPQVGALLLQQELSSEDVPPVPLDVCVAMTQGQIGYLFQQALRQTLAERGISQPVASVTTQAVVDPEDGAFDRPSKPIGPFYTEAEAERFANQPGYVIERVGQGERPYRRVVPSPDPLEIVEAANIASMVANDQLVIACGGGGVPVIRRNGQLEGIDAVIDKDLATERLASSLDAETLMILTDVERVAVRYGTPEQAELDRVSLADAKAYLENGEFPAGSMGPKVKAAVRFLENGGRRAVITSLRQARDGLDGEAGTSVVQTT
ncbi:MAG: carbamate kinase [Candidatus Bipolaricaulia bacterium]